MIRTRWLVPYVVMLLALGGMARVQAAEVQTSPEQASKFVQDLGNRAVTLLTASSDGDPSALQTELRDLIHQGFDLDLISRFALGASWKTATSAQLLEYQQLFAALTADSYARRLGADRGGGLTVIDARPSLDTGDALVRARINRSIGPPFETDLRVRDSEGRMKIIDVTMGGVSMDVTQRDEFASVIKRKGLEGLIGELRARTAPLAVEAAQHR